MWVCLADLRRELRLPEGNSCQLRLNSAQGCSLYMKPMVYCGRCVNLLPPVNDPQVTQMDEERDQTALSFELNCSQVPAFLDKHEPDKPERPNFSRRNGDRLGKAYRPNEIGWRWTRMRHLCARQATLMALARLIICGAV